MALEIRHVKEGELATSYMAWPLNMYFDNAVIPVAGVTMVGTLPAYRRRGHLRKITAEHFKLLYENGEQPVSALFASMAAIYQRFGYAIVSSKNAYSVEPRYLQFSSPHAVKGGLYELADDNMSEILDVYHRYIKPRVGSLRRNEAMEVAQGAPFTVLAMPPSTISPMKFIYRESGKAQGYIIYSTERIMGPAPGQNLIIRDLAWLTPSAYRAIWGCLANMDLVQKINWGRVAVDDPLPHLLLEPRKLEVTSSDGLLARIIDVKRALPLRPYREEGALSFEVIDDFCPWNTGKWKLEVSPTGAEVTQTDGKVQLVMPVSTLAMLMFGQISATEAARMARLDVIDTKALDLWDSVMRTPYRPFCDDMF
jgi:predicted acetyltransferase